MQYYCFVEAIGVDIHLSQLTQHPPCHSQHKHQSWAQKILPWD